MNTQCCIHDDGEDLMVMFSDAIHTINRKRQWAIEQLSTLIRNGNVPKSDDWVQLVLDWLVVHGLFIVKKESRKNPTAAVSFL